MSEKIKLIIDYVFISVLWILVGIVFYEIYFNDFVGHLDNALAFILLTNVTFFKVIKLHKYSWFLIALLVLGVFQIVNFNILQMTFRAVISDTNSFSVGFDYILFLLLVVYCILRRDLVKHIISVVFNGSKEEQTQQENKMIAFYYDKFDSCNAEELTVILKNFGDYPLEAQKALNKIKVERNLINIS